MTPEERKAYNHDYYQRHKGRLIDKRRPYAHTYWEENKEHLTQYNQDYYYGRKAMALIIKTTGERLESHPRDGKHYQLDELQAIVGGYIEMVRLESGQLMFLNEEGKLKGLPINPLATTLYNNPNDVIVGDVLVCNSGQVE